MDNKEHKSEKPVVVTPTEARQAYPSFGLRVLVVSILFVIIVFAATYMFGKTDDPDAAPTQQTTSGSLSENEAPQNLPSAE